jgi:hypothetical protein
MSAAVPNQSFPACLAASFSPKALLVDVARRVVVVAETPLVVFAGFGAPSAVAARAAIAASLWKDMMRKIIERRDVQARGRLEKEEEYIPHRVIEQRQLVN